MAPSPSYDVVPITSPAGLVQELRDLQLLDETQLGVLDQHVQRGCPEARLLARHLLQRGWLTAYQLNQLLQGRGAGLLFGSYVLLERLGEGGMGRVFKARQRKFDRVVAIKVLRRDLLGDSHAMQRFRREIYAMAQLAHPNIVLAVDAGEFNGQQFYVMEHVEGIDLARLLRASGPLPVATACAHVRQAALGLQHAFQRGLIHRDVKPSNLLLATGRANEATVVRPAEDCLIKILDLGLARFALPQDDADTSLSLTRHGTLMGTPDYIAPEQALDPHGSDIRSDLYSLGCTFYQLLAGKVPYPGGTALAQVFRHRLEKPTPLERLRPDVPSPVVKIVNRLMAKRPQDRYQTPDSLAADLETARLPRDQSWPEHASAAAQPPWGGVAPAGSESFVRSRWKMGGRLLGRFLVPVAVGVLATFLLTARFAVTVARGFEQLGRRGNNDTRAEDSTPSSEGEHGN